MAIDHNIRDEKLQYNIKRAAEKISALSSGKTVTNKHDKVIRKERYISPEVRQKFIDDL